MEKIKLISDSTCDLTAEQVEKINLEVIPVEVTLGLDVYLDGVTINASGIVDYVDKTGELPKTSAINSEKYKEYFNKYLDEGYKIIHFNISSYSSVMNSNANYAAEELGGDICVINSKSLSSGQGLQILKVADYIAEGKSYEEVCKLAKELPEKIQTSFVVDRLDYLHKGGRCSLVSMMGAKVLKLHPQIAMADGQLKAKKKYAGTMSRCLSTYIKDLAEEYPSYDKTRCFITHSPSDRAYVEQVIELAKELFEFDEYLESEAGSTVTAHCGPNTIGLLFIVE